MSETTRTLSSWWSLLLLPAGLGVGWWAGQLSGSAPQQPQVAAQPAGGASAVVAPRPDRAAKPSSPTEPAPIRVEVQAQDGPPVVFSSWTSYVNAVAESRSNGKPVLIDFSADWCPPCQKMKRQLFDDRSHGQAVQIAVIPVAVVDRVRETGGNPSETDDLQKRFQVRAFPTLVVYSPATGRSLKTEGFGGAEQTLAWINEAARSVR